MNSELFLSLALRSFVPPLVGLLAVATLWRKSSASTRRGVWLLSFVALATLPLALLNLPAVPVANYDRTTPAPISTVQTSVLSKSLKGLPAQPILQTSAAKPSFAQSSSPSNQLETSSIAHARPSLIEFGLAVWLLGTVFVLVHWLAGLVQLSKLQLQPIEDEELLAELSTACQGLRLRSVPSLAMCPQAAVPMVFGHLRPRLVLPFEAASWDSETRQAVFIHECAHIRGKDWLGLAFSRMVTAAYWLNPLVWLAARQFRAECEAAADDAVLLNGVVPSVYANGLLRIAMQVRRSTIAGALAILEAGPLTPRIARLLDRNRSRRSASATAISLSLLLSCLLTMVLGLTYRTVAGRIISHDGYVDLGHGHHLRIMAIAERTPSGSKAWNMRGEILPNSMPLPDARPEPGRPQPPQEDLRYIVFAQNFEGDGLESFDNSDRTLISGPNTFETVSSKTPGMGYYVSRIDGDRISVASLLKTGAKFASIHCAVHGEQLEKVDEMRPECAATCSHRSPIHWSMTGEEHVVWWNASGRNLTLHEPVVDPAKLGFKSKTSHFTLFKVDVPDSWQGREVVLDIKTSSQARRNTLIGPGRRISIAPGIDARSIKSVTLKVRSLRDILFDDIPLNPTLAIAQTPDLDVPSLQTVRNDNTPGALLGIADLSHPEWGFWRPDGSPMPQIVGVGMPHDGGSAEPTGDVNRRMALLFRSGISGADRVTAADVSGVLLASSISILHTPTGRYDIDTVFVDPDLNSMILISKVPKADTVVERIQLTQVSESKMSKSAVAFLSNRISPTATHYKFVPKLAPPHNIMERSLQFLYADKVAPTGSLQGYSTDWEDGVLGLETGSPNRIVGANVLEHGYEYFSYPKLALFPRSNRSHEKP